MKTGLNRRLRRGTPQLNSDLSVTVFGSDGAVLERIPPADLVRGGYGYLYERLVGLHYLSTGYEVDFRGGRLGFRDRGVDLVAARPGELRFVQCKFKFQAISPVQVERLLYAASAFVAENQKAARHLYFDLVVPSVAHAFPARRERENRALAAFLLYNKTQSAERSAAAAAGVPGGPPSERERTGALRPGRVSWTQFGCASSDRYGCSPQEPSTRSTLS